MSTVFSEALSLTKTPLFQRSGDNTWQGAVRGDGTLMGSVLIVQSLRAVMDAVPNKLVHAFHIQFVGRGSIDKTVEYELEITTAAKSTTTAIVRAYQAGTPLSIMMTSSAMPPTREKPRWSDINTHEGAERTQDGDSLVGSFIEPAGFDTDRAENAARFFPFWFRYPSSIEDEHERILIAAYVSDQGISNSGFPDHVPLEESINNLTLNHSLWLHHPVIVDEWVRVQSRCTAMANGRGTAQGYMITESGQRIATFSQEVLLLTSESSILVGRTLPSA